MRAIFRKCLLLAALPLLSNLLAADEYPDGLLDRAAMSKVAAEITPAKYPDCDDVLVDDAIVNIYQADGTAVTWDDTYIKVLTEKGKRDNVVLSLGFTKPYTELELRRLEVLKPDGSIQSVDLKTQSKEMIDQSQMGSNIYNPDSKILKANVTGLEIGDVVHYFVVRREVKCRVPDTWSDYSLFEYTSAIKHSSYKIVGPQSLPLRQVRLRAEIRGTVTSARRELPDGRLEQTWDVKDVPRLFPEPRMPELGDVAQRLLSSTIPDWQYLSRWYWKLSEPRINAVSQEMRDKVAELVKGRDSDMAKIEAIFQYVSQNIRYMGITTEKVAPGYEPHDAKDTFANKYGVCRDKAALLVSMLRLAGLKAYPVLVDASSSKKDPDVPQPYFNHAISCAQIKDGEYVLMDSTDENTKRLLPEYLCDKSYLVARPEGEALKTTPIIPASENLMRIKTIGAVDADGNLKASCSLAFDGINDNAYRGYFSRLKPQERRRYFESVVKRVAPGAKLTAFVLTPEDMLNTAEPLAVRLEFEGPAALVKGQGKSMLQLPWIGKSVGMANFILGGATGLDKRKYPLVTEIACGFDEQLELALDPRLGAVSSLPGYQQIDTKCLTRRQSLSGDKGALRGSSYFTLNVVEFSPAQYLELKAALKSLEFDARKRVVLTSGSNSPKPDGDVRVLEEAVTYDLAADGSWTERSSYKKEILSYLGKKNNSEIKVSYNPVWEEVEIAKASVRAPDGSVKELASKELNLMDASWVGAAPRYPGAKILVGSLPGVEVGSVIEAEIVRKIKNRPFFDLCESFRGSDPIVKKTVRILAPLDMPLNISRHRMSAVEENVSEINGKRCHEWTVLNQPELKPESSLPPPWTYVPTLLVSAGDWKSYAAALDAAFSTAAVPTPDIQAAAQELVASLRDDRAKAKAVRDYVATRIRSAGTSFVNLPLSALSPAGRTLADGYGNAADTAILLHSLLQAAKLSPEFVVAARYPDLKKLMAPPFKVPQRDLFERPLVKVNVGGEDVFLNDTDQYAPLGATGLDGRQALVPKTAKTLLVKAAKNMEDRTWVEYQLVLNAAGDARVERTRRYYGMAFAASNKMFAETPPEERARYFQSQVSGISQAAKPIGGLFYDFNGYPGVERVVVDAERYCVKDADRYYFDLPYDPGALMTFASDKRDYPLYQDNSVNVAYLVKIDFPAGYDKVSIAPVGETLTAPAKRGKVIIKSAAGKGGKWRIDVSVKLKPAVIPSGEYWRLLEIGRELNHLKQKSFMLEQGPAGKE